MPHQPPPPGLPRKVDEHKKNHVCTQFPTQTCAFSNIQVGFTLGKDLHVLELQIFFDSQFICVCDSYCSFIGMSPFSRQTETLAMIKKKSITITRKTCLELMQLVPRKLCTKYNQEQIQKSLFKLTSSFAVCRVGSCDLLQVAQVLQLCGNVGFHQKYNRLPCKSFSVTNLKELPFFFPSAMQPLMVN